MCVSVAFRGLDGDRLDCCSPPSPSPLLVFLQDEPPPRGVSQSCGCLSVCPSGSVVLQRPLWVFRQGFVSVVSHQRRSLSAPVASFLGIPLLAEAPRASSGLFYWCLFFFSVHPPTPPRARWRRRFPPRLQDRLHQQTPCLKPLLSRLASVRMLTQLCGASLPKDQSHGG